MRRRDLLALPLFAPLSLKAESVPVHYRNDPAYFPYFGLIESGHDEFPADLPMATSPERRDGLFAEVTGTVVDSEQLSRGIPYWAARLDAATGIDIYGNNGIAAGDFDGDGRDEVYVCQPAGLPNKLFRWQAGRLTDIHFVPPVAIRIARRYPIVSVNVDPGRRVQPRCPIGNAAR